MLWSLNYFMAKASPLLSCNMDFPGDTTLLISVFFSVDFQFEKSGEVVLQDQVHESTVILDIGNTDMKEKGQL